ncbi:hypothetical protein P171DRAFT_195334 [Karstenula rhodostoma CBS 690.94]|uniref:F-box domain-containing protein n=1 Tax=Karstenula rhodostoma CBS 690.94 TaxID=1392251 RepID=A0A9P4UF26_9PLEO|nr:hypothetical protein P171DRAFT_195334 [Karstenula rhodostoma CBS 690.94]
MIPAISSLPDELLITIIEFAVFEAVSTDRKTCSECAAIPNSRVVKALSQVSRRFCQIAQPYLFHAARAQHDGSELTYSINSMAKLRETLESREAMCSRVRVLNIYVTPYTAHKDLEAAKHILRRLARPNCLMLEAGKWSHTRQGRALRMAVVNAASQWATGVRHVQVAGRLDSISQLLECRWRDLVRLDLREVDLYSSQEDETFETGTYGNASFTALSLKDCTLPPDAIEALVRWSGKLERFSFIKSKMHSTALGWHPSFLPMLKHQSSTLRTIELCCGNDFGFNEPIFDASLFPNLTHVRLSSCRDTKVLGPSVTHFTWDLSTQQPYSNAGGIRAEDREDWSQFGMREEACLRSIATAAVAQDAALRTIHIAFNPYYDEREAPNPWNHYNTLSAWYPWELMERVRDEVLRPSGRELTYSKPPFESKEAWQRDFAAAVKQRENLLKRSIVEAQAQERELRRRGHR